MNAERNSPPWLLANPSRFNDDDEGGLNLGQIIAVIRRKAFLIAGMAIGVAALAGLKALTDDPVYQGQFEILIEPETVETQVINSTNPNTIAGDQGIATVKEDEIKLKILKSPEVMTPIVEEIQKLYPKITYAELYQNLNVTSKGESTLILTVAYQNEDKQLVKSVLDTFSQAYLNYSLNTRQTGIRRGIDFVDAQLPQLRDRVNVQQQRLQKIRQQNNIVDPEVKGEQLSELIGSFEQAQLQTQIELNEAKALYAALQTELARQEASTIAVSVLSDNTRYQTLLNQLLEVDSQMAKDSVLLDEASPEIMTLKQQRQNLLPLISREALRVSRETASKIQALEARDRILTKTLADLNVQVKQLSMILRQYNEIQQDLEIATENLNQFLSKREGLKIDAAQKEIPWSLLSPPPEEPESLSVGVKKNLLLGGILGLLLGLGAALASDKLSNLLYTSQEVKEAARLPILGVIPLEKGLEKLTPREDKLAFLQSLELGYNLALGNGHKPQHSYGISTSFFEAFRFLYTNIRLLNPNSPIQSLAITSTEPEEGKSTVAIHLAQAAAAMGQRVLLVDTDLRYPSLHERLKLSNQEGLTDILETETPDFNRAIQRSPLEDNLFVLTAGAIPLDPTRLIGSRKMQHLMEKLNEAFDLVVYKIPSLLEVADPYLVATHTDGVLLVAALGKLKRSLLEKALDELRLSGTPVLGVAINRNKDTVTRRAVTTSATNKELV